MKVAKENSPLNIDSLFEGGESTENKDRRTQYPVPDAYDFVGNDATDVTTAHTLVLMHTLQRISFLTCWQSMHTYAIVDAGGISFLPADEQPVATAVLVLTADNVHLLKKARDNRIDEAGALLFNELSRVDIDEVMTEIIPSGLMEKYRDSGRSGTAKGHAEGVVDYVQGVAGTSFAGVGLNTKVYTPATYATMQDLADAVEAILDDD